jgi:pentatricopeptide repeat protein
VLKKQPIPGVAAWNALIAAYVDHGLGDQALECFKSMRLEGVLPGTITYACTLESCGIMQALEMGCQIHIEITKRALETDTYIGSALIGMYGKCGVILEAAEVFNRLPVRDVPTWNAMIKANGENHEGNLALHCFEEMQKQGVNPDGITFICLLAACCHSRHVSKGMKYFELMLELGIEPTWDHHTCIIDLLGRSGYILEAEQFAEAQNCLQCEEVLRALLSASKIHGEVQVGERCFEQLQRLSKDDALNSFSD